MGAHSTIKVTRSKARLVLLQKIALADDKELEDMMDTYLYDQLYNCQIVSDGSENDDGLVR